MLLLDTSSTIQRFYAGRHDVGPSLAPAQPGHANAARRCGPPERRTIHTPKRVLSAHTTASRNNRYWTEPRRRAFRLQAARQPLGDVRGNSPSLSEGPRWDGTRPCGRSRFIFRGGSEKGRSAITLPGPRCRAVVVFRWLRAQFRSGPARCSQLPQEAGTARGRS